MANKLIYSLVVPDQAQILDSDDRRREISSEGTLGDGQPSVTSISPEAETRKIQAQYIGQFAELSATEIRELFSASGISVVPYSSTDSSSLLEEGYYTLRESRNQPTRPSERRAQEFEGQLTKVGTRRSHWRTAETAPTTETNPFGTDSNQYLGLSTRAEKVQWYGRTTGTIEDATAVETRQGEHDELKIYDAQNSSISDPTLIYRIDYRQEWPTDPRVWDDRNQSKTLEVTTSGDTVGSATVGSAAVSETRDAVQWQRVFATDHEYVGTPVFENDLLRLEMAEGDRIYAYEWNDTDTVYEVIQLGNSPWRLFDLDTLRIGTERIDAQLEFKDETGSTKHNLNMSLKRGWDTVLFTVPQNEDPAPQGLIDRLKPIAATTQEDPGEVGDVIKRSEVDR